MSAGVGSEGLVYLHGPPGTGKTHLAWALVHEACAAETGLVVRTFEARDLPRLAEPTDQELALWDTVRDADLVVLENLQRLPVRAAEFLTQLLDDRQAHQQPTLLTGSVAPAQLADLPARLVNRLASGLVIFIAAYSAASRLDILCREVEERNLRAQPEVLLWMAENLKGGTRRLLGALEQLDLLARGRLFPLDVETVAQHFAAQVDVGALSIERIAERVSSHYRVPLDHLQSRARQRRALLPRQVGMYLARQLTRLSLETIGAYFGGHDHSTVLHACRKIERVAALDQTFGGTVRQLQSQLA